MSEYSYKVTKNEENERIDKFLVHKITNESRTTIQKWINEGIITVNQQKVKANYRLHLGDHIQWFEPKKKKQILQAEPIPIDIVYEDHDLLVINKPKGMVVHPTKAHQSGTLAQGLLHYTDELSDIAGNLRPGIIHRIDKDTSGLLLIAKNNKIHKELSKQFKNHEINRYYTALVYGSVRKNQGTIQAPIGRDPNNRIRMTVIQGGREALTHFKVVKRFSHYSLIHCQIITGRTHQIRVHMKYIGHPVVGDARYAPGRKYAGIGQALYARKISFIHPRTEQRMKFSCEAPQSFEKLINKVEKET